ncbi:MAG: HIT family protein [Candidatus Diapherotrites archaeon]|uniref:HIT family protein n=1 Tax=Candidatus Iainarchaeum sp. TaxID=3101447 RepID=A0A938YNB0_9ARCH|nr:HIT family protein [Candidatus Diapherotrites archaeon]
MDGCIFCRIAKGEIPSTKLYEDENILSFLDIMPAAKGHALVIPKKHYHTLLDIPHGELREAMAIVQKVAAAIMAATPGVQGFNVIQSNQKAAGQVIPHLHFHIIPRKENDNLDFAWEQGKAEQEELKKYAEIVKKNLK